MKNSGNIVIVWTGVTRQRSEGEGGREDIEDSGGDVVVDVDGDEDEDGGGDDTRGHPHGVREIDAIHGVSHGWWWCRWRWQPGRE